MSHSQLGTKGALLAKDPAVKSVTVVGASKYGYDAVYLMASHGKRVEWINRKSGGGAMWMALPWLWFGPWRLKLESLTTRRIISWFSPCIWGDCDGFGWVRGLLHGTALGRWLVQLFWDKINDDAIDVNGYRKEAALKDLEPDGRYGFQKPDFTANVEAVCFGRVVLASSIIPRISMIMSGQGK